VVPLLRYPHTGERQTAEAAFDQALQQIGLPHVSARFDPICLENLLSGCPLFFGDDGRHGARDNFPISVLMRFPNRCSPM
jgi:hypothetical protein